MSSAVLLTIIVCECLFPFSIEKSKFPYWEFIGRELPILEHLKRSKIWRNPLSEDMDTGLMAPLHIWPWTKRQDQGRENRKNAEIVFMALTPPQVVRFT